MQSETDKFWKTLHTEELLHSPWLKVFKETCKLPNGKIIPDFYTIWQPDWVLILPKTKKDTWILTKQYRHGSKEISLEFPAGIIEKNEAPLEAAKRELEEETKFFAGNYQFIGKFSVNPDRHRCNFFVYYAEVLNQRERLHQDVTENIEVFEMTTKDLESAISDGTFSHPLQIAAYYKMKLKNFK